MPELNIYQRVNEVRKAVEYVKKDAEVQGYKAVTHDMVTAVLRKHLVEQGIIVLVDQKNGNLIVPQDRDKGIKQHLYNGSYSVSFVNADSPEDRIEITVNAHAADTQDKAPGKAMSYATKYAMLKVFSLETGENEEARFSERPSYTEEQKEQFDELLEAGKALEFLVLEKQLGPEIWSGLYNSFPDGKKVSGKKQVSELSKAGWSAVDDIATQLSQHIDNRDTSGMLEITEELGPIEKKLVAAKLNEHELKTLREVKELA